MPRKKTYAGEVVQAAEPNWWPLRTLVGWYLADWFMWMFEVRLTDGTEIHAYKHIATRCYFHLGADGRAFRFNDRDLYEQIRPASAVLGVFDRWHEVDPRPDDFEPAQQAIRRAVEATYDLERRGAEDLS